MVAGTDEQTLAHAALVPGRAHRLQVALEFRQLGAVPLCAPAQDRQGVSACEHLQHPLVAQLRRGNLGRARPLAQRVAPTLGQLVQLAPPPARLLAHGQKTAPRKALGLGVEGGVRDGPEVLDRLLQRLLEVVGGRRPAELEQAQHGVGGAAQAHGLGTGPV